MAITSAPRRTAVSEGMALGLIMCDRFTLSWDKVAIDLSFDGAWRSWQYRHRFSQVATDIRQGLDGVWAMTRADERKDNFNFYWDTSGRDHHLPASDLVGRRGRRRPGCSVDRGNVPAGGWQEQATDFLERLNK